MDTFIEQIVKKKKTPVDHAITVALVLGLLALTAVTLLFLQALPILFLLLAGAFFGAYYLFTGLSREFEYSVTNGSIDIDTIIGRRSRKRIVSVSGRKIERLLPLDGADFRKEAYQRVVMAAPSDREPDLFFFSYHSKKNGHTAVLFQPNERVLSALYEGLQTTVRLETDRALREKGIVLERRFSSHTN